MRLDIAAYILGALFFALTFISAVMYTETTRILFIASTVVLGILTICLGHYQKLKTKNTP
jgi:VIT1/CCC1 family predicted Fe2+/Mn2+ transporter